MYDCHLTTHIRGKGQSPTWVHHCEEQLVFRPPFDQHVYFQQLRDEIKITWLRVTACVSQNKKQPILYRQEGERRKHQNTKAKKAQLPCMCVYEWESCLHCNLLTIDSLVAWARGSSVPSLCPCIWFLHIVNLNQKIYWWYAESSKCKAEVIHSVYAAVPRN